MMMKRRPSAIIPYRGFLCQKKLDSFDRLYLRNHQLVANLVLGFQHALKIVKHVRICWSMLAEESRRNLSGFLHQIKVSNPAKPLCDSHDLVSLSPI